MKKLAGQKLWSSRVAMHQVCVCVCVRVCVCLSVSLCVSLCVYDQMELPHCETLSICVPAAMVCVPNHGRQQEQERAHVSAQCRMFTT